MFGTPYNSPSWPAGTTEADKAHFRDLAKGGCELNRSEEELARAMAMIGPRKLPAATFDGEPVDAATAAEFRLLGQPPRKTLGLRYDRRAA